MVMPVHGVALQTKRPPQPAEDPSQWPNEVMTSMGVSKDHGPQPMVRTPSSRALVARTPTNICIYIHTYNVCVYIYICTYTYTYIHIYIYI